MHLTKTRHTDFFLVDFIIRPKNILAHGEVMSSIIQALSQNYSVFLFPYSEIKKR